MLNKTINDEPECVCVMNFLLRNISDSFFQTITFKYIISYKNAQHTCNLVVRWLQNTALSLNENS